jgi:NAD(P)-dependent dehydrogenase (short-subunit alcohol dehydrogenase family)
MAYAPPAYPATKAALNMLTLKLARALPAARVNGHSGPQTVEEGAEAIARAACLGPDGPTGTFFDRDGAMAW